MLTTGERTQQTLPGVEEAATPSLSLVEDREYGDDEPSPPALRLAPLAITTGPAAAVSDAPYCFQCGVQMQRSGSCHACPSCGTTSGCS